MDISIPFEKAVTASPATSPTAASFMSAPQSPRRPPVRQRTRFVDSPEGSLQLSTQLPLYNEKLDSAGSQHPSTPLPIHRESSILSALHALHADELVHLFRKQDLVGEGRHRRHVSKTIRLYAYFLWYTWTRSVWNIIMLPTTIIDVLSIIAFALVSTIVLTMLFVWCLVINIPVIITLYERWSRRYANGISLTNSLHPELFDELGAEEMDHAFEALSAPISDCPNTDTKRHFNLDISKLLLQCSAVMYERTAAPLHDTLCLNPDDHRTFGHRVDTNPDNAIPGALLANELGSVAAQVASENLHMHPEENKVLEFAHKHGLEYSTVSELNSRGSAACGMFYDPRGTFIILAYKGTSLEEFEEWASDFTFEPMSGGGWIRGFGKVHGGFFSKVFPKKLPRGTRMPYNTIKQAVQLCSQKLLENQPAGTEINVWTTGHSLGCAIASLVYARQINEPNDFGRSVVIRDAYLFASPILCDTQSVNAFNNQMQRSSKRHGQHPRTMWRVTNGTDIVATGLPTLADSGWSISPYNMFSLGHLGIEIHLKQHPDRCVVRGTHITHGSHVRIISSFRKHNSTPKDHPLEALKEKHNRTMFARAGLRKMERLPVLGRILSHGTAFYWLALRDATIGSCEWDD